LDQRAQEALLLLFRPEEVQDLAVAGVRRLAVEDQLAPERPADLLVQVGVGEEAAAGAAGLRRKVRRPQALRLRPSPQIDHERRGYDSAWAAEAWGTDVVSVLSWLAATTTKLKVGAAIMQMPARTPAMTAMSAATLDLMSGGRFLLGLGTSGPQVVEGWHGQP